MRLFRIELMIFLGVITFACVSDDLDEADIFGSEEGEITATINGSSFRSFGVSSTAFVEDFAGGDQLVIGGIDISDLDRLTGVTVVFIIPDFSALSVGDTFSGSSMDMIMTGGYAIDINGDNTIGATTELAASNTAAITAIDRNRKLVSGTFSYNAIDEDTKNVYEVRNGVFTQIPYEQ